MGQRRPGFTRAGFRRVGAASTASGGITQITSPDLSITVTSPLGPITSLALASLSSLSIAGQARWTLGVARIYAVDFVNGLDTNRGYADAASSSTADYALAVQAAGLVAKKTIGGLAAIFPRVGAGRVCEIVVANGGVNTVQAYTEALETLLAGVVGYSSTFSVRGTGTNTTAGAVAFDGSANDVLYLGAITAPGMNAAGYKPTGSPTTTVVQCLTAAGGAPGFGAEPAAPCGYRIRFDAATATAALRNICRMVIKVAGTDTLTFPDALPAVPVGGGTPDTFYIEQVGVTFPASTVGVGAVVSLAGVGFAGAFTSTLASSVTLAFTQSATSYTFTRTTVVSAARAYTNVARGSQTVGGSRATTSASFADTPTLTLNGLCTVTSLSITTCSSLTILAGFVSGTSWTLSNINGLAGGSVSNIGGTAAVVSLPPRIINGNITLSNGGRIGISQVAINSSGGQYLLTTAGPWTINMALAGANTSITGVNSGGAGGLNPGTSGALNNFGLSTFILGATLPTLTGTVEVAMSGGLNATWAQLGAGAGFTDINGNRFIGAGQAAGVPVFFSGTLFGGAGATLTYLANAGDALAVNNTTPLAYPGPGAVTSTLLVKPRVNTMANACTATLYKNGVATAMTVSIPAGTTAVVSVGGSVQLFPTDVFDLRLDDAVADATHTLAVSATLRLAA